MTGTVRCAAGPVLLALLAAGCGGYEYVPDRGPLPAAPAPGGGELAVRAVRVAETMAPVDVTVRIEGRRLVGVQLERAWLTSPDAPSCRAGWQDDGALVDDRPVWRRPLALAGDGRLDLVFRDAWAAVTGRSVVDLELADGAGVRCLRLELMNPTSGDPAARWHHGPWWLGFKLRSYFPLRQANATHDGHTFVLRFGHNLGWLNAGLSMEAGVAGCLGSCSDPDHYQGLMAGGPSLQAVLLDRGRLVIDAEAAYDFMTFQEQADDQTLMEDKPSHFVHGPRLGLGVFFSARRALPAADRDPRSRYGVELFLAHRRRHGQPGDAGQSLVLGLSLSMGGPI